MIFLLSVGIGIGVGSPFGAAAARASDEGSASVQPVAPPDTLPVAQPAPRHVKQVKKIRKARKAQAREKETEGTEAPNRFKADTVIRSQYRLDGKSLEVDPD